MLRKEEKCVGESLRVPAGGRCSCARDSQQWPLRVTATDKQVSLRHNPSLPPSLPPGVRDSPRLPVRSSLHSLPDPRRPGAPGTRRSSRSLPEGGARGGRRQMSPAPATRGTSEKFSGNWVKRKLARGRTPPSPCRSRASPALSPLAQSSGSRDFSRGYRGGRGRGAENLRLPLAGPPAPDSGRGTPSKPGSSRPRARSGCRGENRRRQERQCHSR